MRRQYIDLMESGILELYVMGVASEEQTRKVEVARAKHPQVEDELYAIHERIENYGKAHAVKPPALVKTVVMAAVDYMERLKNGEEFMEVPLLTAESTIEDFEPWLKREDMVLPYDAENIYAKIISGTPERTTSIVWAKELLEPEIHKTEHESFLIIEGSCELDIEEKSYELNPGDFLSIPLDAQHSARVTSNEPCKFIMQRSKSPVLRQLS